MSDTLSLLGRRNLLFAAAALATAAEETIYIPERQLEKDRELVHSFLASYPFAMLITTDGGLHVTNVPTVLELPANGLDWASLWWHISATNAQTKPLTKSAETTVVFHGPHSYISPNWYKSQRAVPTWNFAVVHCTGHPKRVETDAALAGGLGRLVALNEAKYGGGDWQFDKLPPEYLKGMRQGIVGYHMKIERVEAKFKLGQERSEADRAGILEALRAGRGNEKSIADLTAEYYQRRAK
jgi:transcriptional regulator